MNSLMAMDPSADLRPGRVTLASGITLSYAERGDKAGVPLILLHGYSDSWRSYQPLMDALPATVRAIAVSLRGHGDSDKPRTPCDAPVMATDLMEFVDRLGIARAVIAGHSMGSLVAQRFAATAPQRTLGLVLLGAFRTLRGNPEVEALWREVCALADPVDPAFVGAFQQSTLAQPVPPDYFEMVVGKSLKLPAHAWRSALRGQIDEDLGTLPRIQAPALILWGDKDSICDRAGQQALQASIPHARHVTYAGAGHALHWEEPARAASDIAAFIETLRRP
jgi:pimeloyl-ACP methyl ester carboxylesterase